MKHPVESSPSHGKAETSAVADKVRATLSPVGAAADDAAAWWRPSRITVLGIFAAAFAALLLALLPPSSASYAVDARAGAATIALPAGAGLPEWFAAEMPSCPGDVAVRSFDAAARVTLGRRDGGIDVSYGSETGVALPGRCLDGRTTPVPQGSFSIPAPASPSEAVRTPLRSATTAAAQPAPTARVEIRAPRPVVSLSGLVTLGSELGTQAKTAPVLTAGTVSMRVSGLLGSSSETQEARLHFADEVQLVDRRGRPVPATLVATVDRDAPDQLLLTLGGDAHEVLVLAPGDGGARALFIAPSFLQRLRTETGLFLVVSMAFGLLDLATKVTSLRKSGAGTREP